MCCGFKSRRAYVDDKTLKLVAEELDWPTIREGAKLALLAALKFTGWYLCGKGYHAWELFEYDDGTQTKECLSCQKEIIL